MKAAHLYNLPALRSDIARAKEELLEYISDYDEDELSEGVPWILTTLSPSSAGVHQPSEIAAVLGLNEPDNEEFKALQAEVDFEPFYCLGHAWDRWEFSWEEIEAQVSPINDQLNSLLADELGDEFSLYHGHCESDGSYGLILWYSP